MDTMRTDTPDYRKTYACGWTASKLGGNAMERADMRGEDSAWYDGYLDYAAGRDKWHLLYCTDHESC